MAQRNPMNQRYTGDGPKGQTRKSASKLKPKAEAAASVHIEEKPTTKAERKAASKRRQKELQRKEEERKRKIAEREQAQKQAKIDAGELPPEPEGKKPKRVSTEKSSLQKLKSWFIDDSNKAKRPEPPKTAEYRLLKKIYWALMGVGIAAVAVSFYVQFTIPDPGDGLIWIVPMGIAYVSIIAAIVLDYAKIRRLVKKHAGVANTDKMTPKQLKHLQTSQEAAARLEEAKKAQRESKRANSKIPLYRKPAAGESGGGSGSDASGGNVADAADAADIGEPASIGEAANLGEAANIDSGESK